MAVSFKQSLPILSQESIAPNIYSMWLQAPDIAERAVAGQFVSLYTSDPSKLLPRPISLCQIDREQGRIRLVYRVTGEDTGTAFFAGLKAGDFVEAIGPLGNGFPESLNPDQRFLLIGGGIGIPPLLALAEELSGQKQVILGYQRESFLSDEFPEDSRLFIATEDGSVGTKGTVMDVIGQYDLNADVIFSCGPTAMLKAVAGYADGKRIPCYLSLEERMACGIGACLSCVCTARTKDETMQVCKRRVCKDGPVFLSTEVEL